MPRLQRDPDAFERAQAGELVLMIHRLAHYMSLPDGSKAQIVVKVLCCDREKLLAWGRRHGVPGSWLHVSRSGILHFDFWGSRGEKILEDWSDRGET